MSLRVTGGLLGGRKLKTPPQGVRPSADRVRESVFARLGDLEHAAVLDLYAGSGILGVEAISRGAALVVCVERSHATLTVLRANLESLGLDSVARVIGRDVVDAIRALGGEGERFDLVLLDPPYASDEAPRALAALVSAQVLNPDAVVVLERSRSHPLPPVDGLTIWDERRYGDTVISRFTVAIPAAEAAEEITGKDRDV
jgi:16S rRNA (guanine966-N2)-methyltransferase